MCSTRSHDRLKQSRSLENARNPAGLPVRYDTGKLLQQQISNHSKAEALLKLNPFSNFLFLKGNQVPYTA